MALGLQEHYTMDTRSILIAAQPDWRVNSLRAVLRTLPSIGAIAQSQDTTSLFNDICEKGADLVLLDASLLGDQVTFILNRIKAMSPSSMCIVIVQRRDQHLEATRAGADAVMFDGFRTEKLAETISHMGPPIRDVDLLDTTQSDPSTIRSQTTSPEGTAAPSRTGRTERFRILVVDDSAGMVWSTATTHKTIPRLLVPGKPGSWARRSLLCSQRKTPME